jgi:hypothetical protein
LPALFDLTWKPSAESSELPEDQYPYLGPAVYRGDGYTITLTLLTEDGATPTEYIPEGTLSAQVRSARINPSATPGDALLDFGVDVVDNVVTLTLTGEQTATLPVSAYWDVQESFDDGEPVTWFTGKIKSWGDITRVSS